MTLHGNLLQPEPTLLPESPEAQAALDSGTDPAEVVTAPIPTTPTSSTATATSAIRHARTPSRASATVATT